MERCVVVGAQYGSEGKGRVVQEIAHDYDIHVRTGGPNAGHTIHHEGKKWKMQVIPCGWINPNAELVIGAGAVLDLERMWAEVAAIEEAGYTVRERLHIDPKASILDAGHHAQEGGVDGEMHKLIGSTGEGVGECRMHRMQRLLHHDAINQHKLANDMPELKLYTHDTSLYLNNQKANILLEGTQGTGLSLIHGDWPYVTSRDTTAGQFLVDAGLPPSWATRIILVARTFPIRVAGNSGPLNKEIEWDDISEKLGRAVTETTTVTGKTRRIGRWDERLFKMACRLNGPTEIALTFLDYLDAKCEGETGPAAFSNVALGFIDYVEHISGVNVSLVGTGSKDGPPEMFKW